MSLELRAEVQAGEENLILYFLLAHSLSSAKLPASSLIHSCLLPQLLHSTLCAVASVTATSLKCLG